MVVVPEKNSKKDKDSAMVTPVSRVLQTLVTQDLYSRVEESFSILST